MTAVSSAGAAAPDWQPKRDRHVGIIIVHGIGENSVNYADIYTRLVMGRLTKAERARVNWYPMFWANVTRPHQKRYTIRAEGMHRLCFRKARRFVLSALADAASYNRIDDPNESVYEDVQKELDRAVRHLKDDADPDRPLIIVAHSLGCHIVSTYIHDTWKLREVALMCRELRSQGRSDDEIGGMLQLQYLSRTDVEWLQKDPDNERFEYLQSLCGLIMLGCNIPVFTFRYHPHNVRPIEFPSPTLPQVFSGKTEWLNFFSRFDPLGYPLKPLSPLYAKYVTADIPIWCGHGWRRFTPLSHMGYWTSRKVIGRTVKMIRTLLYA